MLRCGLIAKVFCFCFLFLGTSEVLSAAKGEALVKLCMVTWLIDIFLEITSVACLFVMYICAVLYVLFFASISGIRISQTGSCDVTSRCL